jgi:hypothetical protein
MQPLHPILIIAVVCPPAELSQRPNFTVADGHDECGRATVLVERPSRRAFR